MGENTGWVMRWWQDVFSIKLTNAATEHRGAMGKGCGQEKSIASSSAQMESLNLQYILPGQELLE